MFNTFSIKSLAWFLIDVMADSKIIRKSKGPRIGKTLLKNLKTSYKGLVIKTGGTGMG